MGFDISRFRESEIKEEFICPICHDVLEDPILLDVCEHVFCSKCINEWLQKCDHKQCPIDREAISDKSIRPPQRSFRNLITSLLICCDYQSNGCQQWIKIEELVTHASKCTFNPIVMNEDIECPANCGAIVKRGRSSDEHNCVVYLKRIIAKNDDLYRKLWNENLLLDFKIGQLNDENRQLKNENLEVRDKYEESIKQLNSLCTENKIFAIDLANTKQRVSVNNETFEKLNESNTSKDITISELETQIENLKNKNEKLVIMLRMQTQSSIESNRSVSIDSPTVCSDLLSLDVSEREDLLTELTSDQTDSNDVIKTSVENKQLVEALSKRNLLTDKRVTRAMLVIDRGLFAPSAASYALQHIRSIGYGAHTGPATYEAALLQYLEPHLTKTSKVLDIGSGTGYLTSCIATMIEPKGCVIGIEHIPQLSQQSIETIDKYYPQLKGSGVLRICCGDGRFGHTAEAPYDLIFIEPLTRRVPQKLLDQLKPGGSIVVPIGGRDKDINLEQFRKESNGEIVRLVLCSDWKLMQENTPDLLEDRKLQLRATWMVKLGF